MDTQLRQLGIDAKTISDIVKDPSSIRSSAIDPAHLVQCIQAYASSFHKLFIVVLTLLLFCFVISITLLKDYSLVREDDEARIEEGLRWMAEQNQKDSKNEADKDEKIV
jgi:mannitol-specific phosphotransferase system IIBC component